MVEPPEGQVPLEPSKEGKGWRDNVIDYLDFPGDFAHKMRDAVFLREFLDERDDGYKVTAMSVGILVSFKSDSGGEAWVKMMHPKGMLEDKRGKFVQETFGREVGVMSQLDHENIVEMLDAGVIEVAGQKNGETERFPVMVLEFIDGKPLSELEIESVGDRLHVLRQIGKAFDYIHEQGLVHADPGIQNFLVDKQYNAWLTDFGSARSIEDKLKPGGTMSASAVAPELLGYGSEEIGPETDVFGLASAAYKMWGGDPVHPYEYQEWGPGEKPEGARKSFESADLIQAKGMGDEVYRVLQKALNFDSRERYGSAGEFVAALEEAVELDSQS